MAIGYSDKVVRRLKAAATLTQYQVVKQASTAGQVDVAGAGEQPYGIAMEAANLNEYVDVVTEGSYFAVAAASISRPATLAVAASGTITTANSTHGYTLGVLGDDQASVVTDGVAKVVIDKQIVAIA